MNQDDGSKKLDKLGNGVYMLHNYETGGYYLGSSCDLNRRLKDHTRELKAGKHKNYKLQAAYDNNPNFQAIPVPLNDKQISVNVEDALIKENWGDPNLLNIAKDVQRFRLGSEVSQETKDKQSRAQKQLYASGYVNPMQGQKHSQEIKDFLRKKAIEQYQDPIQRKLASDRGVERMSDPEHRKKISSAVKRTMNTPEVKAELTAAAIVRWQDPVQRTQLVNSAIARAATPEGKLNSSNGGKAAWNNPEFREKMTRKVIIDGVVYSSLTEAALAFNVSIATVKNRAESNSEQFKNWHYL